MQFRGWLAIAWLCAGCGDDANPSSIDAAVGLDAAAPTDADSTIDAPPDGPTTNVAIRVTKCGVEPLANRIVYFQHADGTVASREMTDAEGRARGLLPAGGWATLLHVPTRTLAMWRAEPGDEIEGNECLGIDPPTTIGVPVTVALDPASRPAASPRRSTAARRRSR